MKIRGKKIAVRFPVPRPTKVHGSAKGAKAYDRGQNKRLERLAKENRYND